METFPSDLDRHVKNFFDAQARSLSGKKQRVKEIEEQIHPLLSEQKTLKQEIREAESPFRAGDIIEWTVGMKGKTRKGRVYRVAGGYASHTEWDVFPILKDGTEGSSVRVREYNFPKKV